MHTYLIVESPGKIQSIQKYLGDKYVVLASKGHINELAKGGKFGIGVDPLNRFKTTYTLLPDKIAFLDQIISNEADVDKIVLATDGDTEGHAISFHIAHYLKHLNKPMQRVVFNEITKLGIEEGLKHPTEIDVNQFKSQETRRIADRLIGFMVSPFLMHYYGGGASLSAGRVQSCATRLIVEREREITNFKPQEYWTLSAELIKDQQTFLAKYPTKIKNQAEAIKIKTEMEQPSVTDSVFRIVNVDKKPRKEFPNPPLNTAKMQQLMASKFGIDGEATMSAAQILYESGFVTYIRTDSVRSAETSITNVREWLSNNGFEIPNKPYVYKNKNEAAQDAHEAIRPTNLNNVPDQMNLGSDTKILYKLIWDCFVSSQMQPAIYDTLDAKIIHDRSNRFLKITGKLLSSPGYLTVLEGKVKSTKELPTLNPNDILGLTGEQAIQLEQKFTQPPARYNYGSLIEKLENNGIGRPSTYANIIGTIANRNYVIKQGNTYHGTELGDKITTVLSNYFEFMQYAYTSNLEGQMDEIALGKLNYLDVLSDFYLKFKTKLNQAHTDQGGIVCEKCGTPVFTRRNKEGLDYQTCMLGVFCRNNSLRAA